MKTANVNAATLAKLGWKICVQAVYAKYLNKGKFLEVKTLGRASIMWKYIPDHYYLLKEGLRWAPRNGLDINSSHNIWMDTPYR